MEGISVFAYNFMGKDQKKAILGFVLAFTSVFCPGTILYSRLRGGDTSSICGGHRPRNALQWHRACYFLLEHNLRMGAKSVIAGNGPEMPPVTLGLKHSLVTQLPVCSMSFQTLGQCYCSFLPKLLQ